MNGRMIDEQLLRMMCSRLEVSDAEIGKRFGVTREGIRRARNRLGITGRGLERIKMLKEQRKQFQEYLRQRKVYARNSDLREIRRRAAGLHLGFEILMRPPFGRWLRIGNSICYLAKGRLRIRAKRPNLSYAVLYRPQIKHDFDVAIVRITRGWMMIPRDRFPARNTMFVVGRKKGNPGTNSKRRDWAKYYYTNWDWLRGLSRQSCA